MAVNAWLTVHAAWAGPNFRESKDMALVPYRLWRSAHRFEHPKFTPYYFSLALIFVGYSCIYIYINMDPICIIFVRGSILKFLLDRMCSSKKCSSFWFLCIASKLGDNCQDGDQVIQIPSNYHEHGKIDRPKITKLTFFSICGNLRSFCRFLHSFCGLQFVRLRPKKKKWTFLAWDTLVELRLAQIVLQGPCTMQNWKKRAISEDLSVWHVLGICDRVSKCGTNCKGRGYRYTYTW